MCDVGRVVHNIFIYKYLQYNHALEPIQNLATRILLRHLVLDITQRRTKCNIANVAKNGLHGVARCGRSQCGGRVLLYFANRI